MNDQEFENMLSKYADVVVKVGLNLRKGQKLSIRAIIEDAPFIRKVTESAYKAGAKYVDVLWVDERLTRIRFEYADPESLTETPNWLFSRFEEHYQNGEAELAVYSTDPDLLAGIDPELIARERTARAQKFEPLRKYENVSNWCVVATASPAWARKVFPDLSTEDAQSKLWEAIFNACRIDLPDPIEAWKIHTSKLSKYKDHLTNKHFDALHYRAPGTDLIVGLPENHVWQGAEASFKNGITNTVNIPTEEVFTLPHKDRVDGIVAATRPLNLSGRLIEDFSLTFENGRAVKVNAKNGGEDFGKLIETDESACRLGEAALVPNSSPISQRGHLFYNTLFDENASCHLAVGNAYRDTMLKGVDMTDEEFQSHGGNKSLIHTDFMIGSEHLGIDGIHKDGTREPIMRKGEWAFEV